MKRLTILGVVLGTLTLAPAAQASTITFTLADLLLFAPLPPGSNVDTQDVSDAGDGSVQIEAKFLTPLQPGQYAEFEVSGLNIANNAGDFFALNYLNSNSNPWKWTLTLYGGGGGSDSTTVAATLTDVLWVALDGTAITGAKLKVEGKFAGDLRANSNFSAVPDFGSSLLLMGLGLAGLGAYRNRIGL